MSHALRRAVAALLAVVSMLCAHGGAAADVNAPPGGKGVEIRWTTDGIPHVRADRWRDLGVGIGYVQARDALCTLAEAFVTYEGRRSWFFGADARPLRDSTFGRPRNLDLDFFFRAFADDTVVARYREQNPAQLNELVDGYAAGYNRYLAQVRSSQEQAGARSCLQQPWVREIAAADIYRRMYAGQVAAGYLRFVAEIANARPLAPAAKTVGASGLRKKLRQSIGEQPGLGSNVLAFGRQATGENAAVLFGNPHWYWGGPDRFYQMHLTIPGQLDVAGVAFLGVPLIMIGFNEHVAWSHTVSEARRFGLADVALDPADPTRYRVDGRSEAMTAREISIETRGEKGAVRTVKRTFYRTRFGPLVDLGQHNAAFAWGREHAVAIRDINADNFRIFRNYFYWSRAASLEDFIAIQRREAAVPWVNTVAIGRGDGRVWFGDVGAVPNVADALRETCSTPLAAGFARIDPLTPFLDASRTACEWRSDTAAPQPGAMPVSQLPSLLREDYVANMNNSYWLSNPQQPLEGFASLLGGERRPLSLRGRLGHNIARQLLRERFTSAEALSQRLMQQVLSPRAYSAELFKDELLNDACRQTSVELEAETLAPVVGANGKTAGPNRKAIDPNENAAVSNEGTARKVDINHACGVLRRWPNRADTEDRGALLWDAFWTQLRGFSAGFSYAMPFSSASPLDTPRKLRVDNNRAAQALALAVLKFEADGVALDAPLGSRRFVESEGRRLPLYGGCPPAGYFTIACNDSGADALGPDSMANSYLQVVRFGAAGVEAHTLLAHGQDETALAADGRGSAPVARYARKEWLRFPFRDDDIARDPWLQRLVLPP